MTQHQELSSRVLLKVQELICRSDAFTFDSSCTFGFCTFTAVWIQMQFFLIKPFHTDMNYFSTETCVDRCGTFDPRRKCQCDSMCVYYGSCCGDFDTICPKKSQFGLRISSFRWIIYLCFNEESSCWFFMWQNSAPSVARGDTFEETDEVTEAATTPIMATVTMQPTLDTAAVTSPASPPPPTSAGPTPAVDPDAAPCSGRAFDAFLQLKNGSIYAFRGTFLSWGVFISKYKPPPKSHK